MPAERGGAEPAEGSRLAPRPVERRDNRLINEVYKRLRAAIVSGEIMPDTRLLQQRLAVSLGVSRTPLREALLRLERDGFIYTLPNRGMFVRGLTIDDVGELYQLREVLEPVAARLACEVVDEAGMVRVRAIQRALEDHYPASVSEAFQCNVDLHTTLIRWCPNRRMAQYLQDIWDQHSAFLIFSYYARSVGATSDMVREHREIVDAFIARDGARVEELLRLHIRCAADALAERMAYRPPEEREA